MESSSDDQHRIPGADSNIPNLGSGWAAAMADISEEGPSSSQIRAVDSAQPHQIRTIDTFGAETFAPVNPRSPPSAVSPRLGAASDVSQIAEAQESIAEVFGEVPAHAYKEQTLVDFSTPILTEEELYKQRQQEIQNMWEGDGPGSSIQKNDTNVSIPLILLDSTETTNEKDYESEKVLVSPTSFTTDRMKSFEKGGPRPPRPPKLPPGGDILKEAQPSRSTSGENENDTAEPKSSSEDDDLTEFITKFTEGKPSMEELEDILGPRDDENEEGQATGSSKTPEEDADGGYVFVETDKKGEKAPPATEIPMEQAEDEVSNLSAGGPPTESASTSVTGPDAGMLSALQNPPPPPPPPPRPAASPNRAPAPTPAPIKTLPSPVNETQSPGRVMPVAEPSPAMESHMATGPDICRSGSDPFEGTAMKSPAQVDAKSESNESSRFWKDKNPTVPINTEVETKSSDSPSVADRRGKANLTVDTGFNEPHLQTKAVVNTDSSDDDNDGNVGGRLWEAASLEAQKTANSKNSSTSPEASRFAESLMARTRSRADPDAVVNQSGSLDRSGDFSRPNMVRIGEHDDTFILNTALARKRVRVVQLLIVGLVGLLVGFLGSFYVQSSCHFISASVEVGQEAQVFSLHYGLWKYTPMDSVFQGYSYCYHYDQQYTRDSPLFPRWASCIALVGGSFSLGVLWCYLIFGKVVTKFWRVAVGVAAVSGVLQLCTLFFFTGQVCRRDACTLGPAGVLSVVASIVWFILAFEMHYNTPMTAWVADITANVSEEPGVLVANLEMTDFEVGAKAFVKRLVRGDESPYRTLNQLQRDNNSPRGGLTTQNSSPYKPPAIV